MFYSNLCFAAFLISVTRASTDATAVVLCRDAFPVRKSACDSVPADQKNVVPTQSMRCTEPMSVNEMSQLLSSPETSRLDSIKVGETVVNVMYNDCGNPSALPALESGVNYLAVIVLDNNAAFESSELQKILGPGATDKVTIMSSVYYYETSQLGDPKFRTALASAFHECNGKKSVCKLPYNSMVISKPAIVEIPFYLD